MNFLEAYLDMVLSYHDGAKKAIYHFDTQSQARHFRERALENNFITTAKRTQTKVTIEYEKTNLHPDTTDRTNS